ncbi:MAG: hypothetical protein P8Y18_02690 [Candidatus Bathyarchaeota archaeon]
MSLGVSLHKLFEVNPGKPLSKKKESHQNSCPHYFGYLSEHGRASNFPDECLICPNAVNCIFVPSANLNADLYFRAIKEKETRELAQFL